MLFNSKVPIIKLPQIFYEYKDELNFLFEKTNSQYVFGIGRSEAVHLSPNGDKIGYCSFNLNKIIIFNIEKENQKIKINNHVVVECQLNYPHDFSWIDNSTIVVANREGPAIIFSIPEKSGRIEPILIIDKKETTKTNSVTIIKQKNMTRLMFCNVSNYVSYCDIDINFQIKSIGIYLKSLNVPDGVAINPSQSFISITNALGNNIIVCNLLESSPIIELKEINRPHSVEFLTDNILLSTGGNDPFVYCWDLKNKNIKFKFRAINKKQYSLTEGGIKGICACLKSNILFLTSPDAPFLMFDLNLLFQKI